MEASEEDLEAPEGVGEESVSQLAFRYGHEARTVLGLVRERPELGAPIVAGRPDLLAEVVIAVRNEQARTVADVLLRRTRLGLLAARESCAAPTPSAPSRRQWRWSWAGRRTGPPGKPAHGLTPPPPRALTRPSPERSPAAGSARIWAQAADGSLT